MADFFLAAFDGATDQFEDEVSALSNAANAAAKAMAAEGGAS
jgi:hypothetical protein